MASNSNRKERYSRYDHVQSAACAESQALCIYAGWEKDQKDFLRQHFVDKP